jgi:hypothetical protein
MLRLKGEFSEFDFPYIARAQNTKSGISLLAGKEEVLT